MESPTHYQNSSTDDKDHETRFRECNDMLARRLGSNIPAPLRKKKEENYKQFITPSGNPIAYVRQHIRSKSLSDIQIENAERDHERDERNVRYEEIQKVKELLKEEEETWTTNLDSWKQRRRSATLDARRRKEDRDSIAQHMATTQHRRPKTYKEMVEDKKRRESGFSSFDSGESDDYWTSQPAKQDDSGVKTTSPKSTFRETISVPHLGRKYDRSRTPSPAPTKTVVEPVKYTSKVTARINHVPTRSQDSFDRESVESPKVSEYKTRVSPRVSESKNQEKPATRKFGTIWPPPPSNEPARNSAHLSNESYNAHIKPSHQQNYSASRSRSPPAAPQVSRSTVTMRPSRVNKERPKSAYGSVGGDRAATLPRNYHNYSSPRLSDDSQSSFVQNRKSAFADKRSMWENMSHQKEKGPPPAPQHLASLLKHDTDRLFKNEHPAAHNGEAPDPRSTASEVGNTRSPVPKQNSDLHQNGVSNEQQEYKPKTKSSAPAVSNACQPASVRSWQRPDTTQSKVEAKSIYKHVSAPQSRAPWTKSATLPSRTHIQDYNNENTKANKQENLHKPSSEPESKISSPRSPGSDVSPHPEEMKICINQRPKSEKGFGFTVRGGDDGRPVIVDTVSPGGAAAVCQLCLGDEILAINDVRLTPSLTQDGIVRLIVDSVMTGNLSLDIRRYKKSKKSSSLRLAGTKVVMTSGGFVQVRSDKGKPAVVSTRNINDNAALAAEQVDKPASQQVTSPPDLPFPPLPENLEPPKRLSAVDRLVPKQPSPSAYRQASPLSNLINAAKSTSQPTQDSSSLYKGKENDFVDGAFPIAASRARKSPMDYEDELESDVLKAQRELAAEESYLQHERKQHEENMKLRKQLLEEQRLIEEREAKREEEKRRRIEEAKAEEQRLEEELRKIEAAKLEQQRRREEEKRRLMEDTPRYEPNYNPGGLNHWLIEEAERSRLAEEEGRRRTNPFEYNNASNLRTTTPNQHLYQNNSGSSHAHIPGSLANYWNDPKTRATLL